MKKMMILLGLAVTATGCARTRAYLIDRGRDAADIVTCNLGYGLGAKVRAGPVHLGALRSHTFFRLQGGAVGVGNGRRWDLESPVPVTIHFSDDQVGSVFHQEVFSAPDTLGYEARKKDYYAYGDFPFVTTSLLMDWHRNPGFHPYWTTLEVTLAVGPALTLGYNPGELLDFILGWTTIDIFGDDLEGKNQKGKSKQQPEGIRR